MTTVAIAMFGHNEAHLLPAALESVKWADQIVYVDCESKDNSREVAQRYTELVFSHPNGGSMLEKRTFSFAHATSEWIFYMDPDEVLPEALGKEIQKVISADPKENGFTLPRRNYYFGRWLRRGRQYPDTQLRLFRKDQARFPGLAIHDRLQVDGLVGSLRQPMEHFTSITVFDSIEKLDRYTTAYGEEMANKGMAPSARMAFSYMVTKPVWRFVRRFFFARGFLDGWPGFITAAFSGIEYQFRFIKFWQFYTDLKAAEQGGKDSPS